MASLLAGRNLAPLDDAQKRRAYNTFTGFDNTIAVRFEENSSTRFHVFPPGDGQDEYGEIVFSSDLYQGNNVANANSTLSMPAACAHELAHYYRWRDMRELNGAHLRHLDEALTSLEAAQRFGAQLSPAEVQQLIADAAERLRLHIQEGNN